MDNLNEKLAQLKELETTLSNLTNQKDEIRNEVFTILKEQNIGQYKSDIATVSYIQRKAVKYQDKQVVLKQIEEMNLPKYLQIIPEHKEINKTFEDDIKNGVFAMDGVTVETNELPQIRFAK